MKRTSVLLISQDAAVRSSLARLLELEPDLEVYEDAYGLNPDVVVVNLVDREQAGWLRSTFPHSRILSRVSFLRPELRQSPEVDRCIDSVAPYEVLLAAIRGTAAMGQRAG